MKTTLFQNVGMIVGLFSVAAQASTIDLTRVETRNAHWIFKKGSNPTSYEIVKNLTTSHGEYRVTADVRDVESSELGVGLVPIDIETISGSPIPFSKEDQDLPGKAVHGQTMPGHARLSLFSTDDGKVFLEFDLELVTHSGGIDQKFKSNDKIELEIVKGTWSDFLNGSEIQLKATQAGEQTYLASRREIVNPSIVFVSGALMGLFQGAASIESAGISKLAFLDSSQPGITITAKGDTLEIAAAPIETVIESKLHVDVKTTDDMFKHLSLIQDGIRKNIHHFELMKAE